MRQLINTFLEWVFDYNADEAGGCLRFVVLAGVIGFLVIGGIFGIIISLNLLFPSRGPAYLFCPEGSQVVSTPDTRVIGKTPVPGTSITCTDGISG